MSPRFLILSGTYVDSALTAEFGRVPPSFLPVGTHRLFEDQIAFAARHGCRATLTLPDDFEPGPFDVRILERAEAAIVKLPARLSLADALGRAIDAVGAEDRLTVLFGDTLVEYGGALSEPDTFAAGVTSHLAIWAEYAVDADGVTRFTENLSRGTAERSVACGLFDFSDARLLRECLAQENDFFAALDRYSATHRLRAVTASRWLDFGHLHTYFQSRKNALAVRQFNEAKAHGAVIRKSGEEPRKIFAEAEWYRRLPPALKTYVPQFVGVDTEGCVAYEIEYLFLPALSELFCFSALPAEMWRGILASCREFLETSQTLHPAAHELPADFGQRFFADMVASKSACRLHGFARSAEIDLRRDWTIDGTVAPSLSRLLETLTRAVGVPAESDICVWHGDFHFANLLFDFRAQRVKCIDPRGMLSDGSVTMFGDARYDIAKLTHSVVGLYDFIVAGRYDLIVDGSYGVGLKFDLPADVQEIQRSYAAMRIGRYGVVSPQILALCALLFLSMLPLHGENRTRQFAMLANGYRLARLAGAI